MREEDSDDFEGLIQKSKEFSRLLSSDLESDKVQLATLIKDSASKYINYYEYLHDWNYNNSDNPQKNFIACFKAVRICQVTKCDIPDWVAVALDELCVLDVVNLKSQKNTLYRIERKILHTIRVVRQIQSQNIPILEAFELAAKKKDVPYSANHIRKNYYIWVGYFKEDC